MKTLVGIALLVGAFVLPVQGQNAVPSNPGAKSVAKASVQVKPLIVVMANGKKVTPGSKLEKDSKITLKLEMPDGSPMPKDAFKCDRIDIFAGSSSAENAVPFRIGAKDISKEDMSKGIDLPLPPQIFDEKVSNGKIYYEINQVLEKQADNSYTNSSQYSLYDKSLSFEAAK